MSKKRGRPTKLDNKMRYKIFFLARRGLTDAEIAEIVDICEDTITKWKKDPDFFLPLKDEKDYADRMVQRSLYERAIGYNVPEEKIFQYEGSPVRVDTMRHYPPDVTAQIFWLKNRQPDKWREREAAFTPQQMQPKFTVIVNNGKHDNKSESPGGSNSILDRETKLRL